MEQENSVNILEDTSGADQKEATDKLPREFIGKTGAGKIKINVPERITINSSLDEIFVFARKKKATDVHISVDIPIFFRVSGVLKPQTEEKVMAEEFKRIISRMLTNEQLNIFNIKRDLELVYVIEGAGRFRVTLVKKNPGWDLTARLIPMELCSFKESGMPESCLELTNWAQGMVLVTGPAGCGKTTTLSILCEMINHSRTDHIITIEQPIEFVFTPKKARISQRELKLHTFSQDTALRAALRQDPDIIVISELRDPSMIQLAATAAETGHLVLGTMNTNDAAQTILRIVNSFSYTDRSLVQNMIAESLRGVICQQLVPRKDGTGVVPAFELIMVNLAVANLIRKGSAEQIIQVISTGAAEGMITMDKSLMKLLKSGIISWDEAYRRSVNKRDFAKLRHLSFK